MTKTIEKQILWTESFIKAFKNTNENEEGDLHPWMIENFEAILESLKALRAIEYGFDLMEKTMKGRSSNDPHD